MGQDLPGLPEALRLLRERSGLSQAALAQEAGGSQSQVGGYEKGLSTPGAGTLARLLGAMGSNFADLEDALREVRGEPRRSPEARLNGMDLAPPSPATKHPPPDLHRRVLAALEDERRIAEEVERRAVRMVRLIMGAAPEEEARDANAEA